MAGSREVNWLRSRRFHRPKKVRRKTPYGCRLGFEPLEDRRMLSITVNTLVDENNGIGVGDISLRDAIAAATPCETIDFSVTGTINLTSLGDLIINKSLTINGPGAGLLTINAFDPTPATNNGDGSRVFNVDDGVASILSDVQISGLTLTGGDVAQRGGAISNGENLTLDQMAVSGNSASAGGGISHNPNGVSPLPVQLVVTNSRFSGNFAGFGGGVFISNSYNPLVRLQTTISGSTLSGNSAEIGGGIFNSGAAGLSVADSTISGNSASDSGGGIENRITSSVDQAVYRTTISNSTISGNSAVQLGGGIDNSSGLTVIRHTTITANTAPATKGSGVASRANVSRTEVYSSIIAGNTNSDVDATSPPGSAFVSLGYNVIGAGNSTGLFSQTGDQTGISAASLLLGPLAINGGPTNTHALLAGSPAINAGDASAMAGVGDVPEYDQRGAPESRIRGGQIDIGAFEFNNFTSLTVTTLVDENNGIGVGGVSLREAIASANSSAGFGLIQFDASLVGTMALGSQLPLITKSMIIAGLGAEVLTIQAFDPTPAIKNGDGSRVFQIDNLNAVTRINVSIGGLTVTGGDVSGDGGAIHNVENLTLTSSVITGNAAIGFGGGIYNAGATSVLTLSGVAVSNNKAGFGGGILNLYGTIAVTGSAISDNVVTGNGGGIQNNLGRLTVTNSTISGNNGLAAGGGILSYFGTATTVSGSTISGNTANLGGGIWIRASTANVTSSTISGNMSRSNGGGIYRLDSSLTLKHSTIANNLADSDNNGTGRGGGIFGTGSATIIQEQSIVAGNNRSISTDDDIFGAVTAQFSVIGDNNGATITNNGGNFIGTAAAPLDSLLGPLAENGGPTMTHALQLGSVAINSGDPAISTSTPPYDQRGSTFVRVFGGRIDIGAFEFQIPSPPQTLVVDSLADVLDGNHSAGNLSLREAIKISNDNYGVSDVITFAGALHGGTINLTSPGQLAITDSVSIDGPGANQLAIKAYDPTPGTKNGDGSRVFSVDDGGKTSDVSISGLTLTGGDVTGYGGAIRNGETLMLSGVTISGSHATVHGGGVFSPGANLTIANSTFSGNSAGDRGGAIYTHNFMTTARTTISNCTFSGNSANRGGGIFAALDVVTVSNSTLSGNSANRGGGIYFYRSDSTVSNSTISGNSASDSGGGIYNRSGLTAIRHSTITGNTAPATKGSGVASYAYATRTEVESSIVAGNANSDVDFVGGASNSFQSNGFNLIGTGNATGEFVEPGDQSGVANPLLGVLADNGGPTMTHALLVGSPAIDMGDPAVVFNPADFEQRGNPFVRVFDGNGDARARIDIGSYERQTVDTSNFVVDTLTDENDGNYSLGDRSLREAIGVAHGSVGAETITFAAALAGGTILLTEGELAVTDAVTIVGPGATLLTIDASGNDPTPVVNHGDGSRIFNIDDGDNGNLIDVEIIGLTLIGGDAQGGGGAIANHENLSVSQSTISGNNGGGLFNYGGGIRNFFNGNLIITRSTISGNSARSGGGIGSRGNLTVIDSTISGNTAAAAGGGIDNRGDLSGSRTTSIIGSTISGNTAGVGGGIYNQGLMLIRHSTITNNSADVEFGSGIASEGNSAVTRTEINGTIIAGNVNSDVDVVTFADITFQSHGYNVIGTGSALGGFNQTGDQTGVVDPMLGDLGDNGGPTMTHALLAGSPAIDSGNPGEISGINGVPAFDQRGAPFARIYDGDTNGGARIDVGALELQPLPDAFFGDYNQNGSVDAADYVVWRDTLGTNGVQAYSGADGDGDATIDQDDYNVWRAHFGMPVPTPAAGSTAAVPTFSAPAIQIREPAVLLSTDSTSTPAKTDITVARAAGFAVFDNLSRREDSGSRSRGWIHRYGLAESGRNDLLLLAIDRVERNSLQGVGVVDDRERDDVHADDRESQSLIDESPAVALAEWRWVCGYTSPVRR